LHSFAESDGDFFVAAIVPSCACLDITTQVFLCFFSHLKSSPNSTTLHQEAESPHKRQEQKHARTKARKSKTKAQKRANRAARCGQATAFRRERSSPEPSPRDGKRDPIPNFPWGISLLGNEEDFSPRVDANGENVFPIGSSGVGDRDGVPFPNPVPRGHPRLDSL